jgi:hypothetical protein
MNFIAVPWVSYKNNSLVEVLIVDLALPQISIAFLSSSVIYFLFKDCSSRGYYGTVGFG